MVCQQLAKNAECNLSTTQVQHWSSYWQTMFKCANFSCSSGVETVNRFGKLLQKEKNFKGLDEYYEKDPPKKAQTSKRDEYHYHNTNGLHCDRHTWESPVTSRRWANIALWWRTKSQYFVTVNMVNHSLSSLLRCNEKGCTMLGMKVSKSKPLQKCSIVSLYLLK